MHFGQVNGLAPRTEARLNLIAANNLLTALNLPAIAPEVPLAPTVPSYQQEWQFSDVSPLDRRRGTIVFY